MLITLFLLKGRFQGSGIYEKHEDKNKFLVDSLPSNRNQLINSQIFQPLFFGHLHFGQFASLVCFTARLKNWWFPQEMEKGEAGLEECDGSVGLSVRGFQKEEGEGCANLIKTQRRWIVRCCAPSPKSESGAKILPSMQTRPALKQFYSSIIYSGEKVKVFFLF